METPISMTPHMAANYDPHSSKNYYWVNHPMEKMNRTPQTSLSDINEKRSVGKNPLNLNGFKSFDHSYYSQQASQTKQNLHRSSSASLGLYDMEHFRSNRQNTTSLSSIPQESFGISEFTNTPLYEVNGDYEEAFLNDYNHVPQSPDMLHRINSSRNFSTLYSNNQFGETDHKDFAFSSLPSTFGFNSQNHCARELDPVAQDFKPSSTTPKFSLSGSGSSQTLNSSGYSALFDPFQNSSNSSNIINNSFDTEVCHPFTNHDNTILSSNNIKNNSNSSSISNNIFNNHFNHSLSKPWNQMDPHQENSGTTKLDYNELATPLQGFGNNLENHDAPWLLITGINPKV